MLFGTAGLLADGAGSAPEAGWVQRDHRPAVDGGSEAAAQAAPHGEAHFDRLRAEHGFSGVHTIVKDYVREHYCRRREMSVSLIHPPGQGQADFGEARVVIGGVARALLQTW